MVWRFGFVVASPPTKLLYAGPVSTGMGDRVRGSTPGAGDLSQHITSHPGQLSRAIPTYVGAMSTSHVAGE